MAEDLNAIHEQIRACDACALAGARTNAVPGEGLPAARIMFVGEAPGFNEDRQGRPFIGAAGQFLNELLASIDLAREDVFITNLVKCRPPNNRDPFPGEVAACASYLEAQIEAIKPDVIIPLGRHALAKWFPNESISKVRAKAKQLGKTTILPLYHPAAALHNGGLRSTILSDFQKIRALLDNAPDENVPTSMASASPLPGQQTSFLDASPPSELTQAEKKPGSQNNEQLSLF